MDENTKLAPPQSPSAGSSRNDIKLPFSFSEELPTARHLQSGYPKAWYLFGSLKELSRGPVTKQLLGQPLVGFKTVSGKTAVMSGRCSHLGSDLGNGCVVGESIQCPFHGWEYATDGRCTKVPATESIPLVAKQKAFETTVLHGNVYFFNASKAEYSLPFFEGVDPDKVVAAPPFVFELNTPWYMIGSNGVDEQHFRWAHGRKLIEGPDVEYPAENLHRTIATFEVEGDSIPDRLTKLCGGKRVTLKVDDWSSTFILTRSTLKKTESFGVLSATPITPTRTRVTVTACGWKNKTAIGRLLIDPISARIRRYFIQEFLRSDVAVLEGSDFSPHSMLDIDQQYIEYMQWVAALPK